MPQKIFEVTAPDGRVLEISGDRAPSEQELQTIFAQSAPPRGSLAEAPRTPTTGERVGGVLGQAIDMGFGAAKGVGNSVFGLGKLARDYTPIGRISDAILPGAFDKRPGELIPQNTAQRIGYTGEQVGEFFLPSASIAKLGRLGDVARSVGQTLVQSSDPTAAGISGAVTAVLPGGSAIAAAPRALERSAEKSVAQALGATKEWAKAEAAKLAPEMVKRGIGGSRDAMLTLAKDTSRRVGQNLDDAYKAAAAAGETVTSAVVKDHVRTVAESLKIADSHGALRVIPGTERVIARLQKLDDFVGQLGDQIPVDKAAHIKRTWDTLVSKAGLFGQKAGASATDQSDAWALREASGAFRELLNRNPTIAALNQEAAFWTGLKNVLKETEKRTQAQSSGLGSTVVGAAGFGAGALQGDSLSERATNAALYGFGAKRLTQALQSPWFRTELAAPFKHKLAEALASGKPSGALMTIEQMAKQASKAQ
jgi:hypothetical protein